MIPTDKHYLTLEPGLDYEFILDDLELAFTKQQLDKILRHWHFGKEIEEIAEMERRDPTEILLALIHLSRKRRVKRPFARRII